jgi:hypothetical protein
MKGCRMETCFLGIRLFLWWQMKYQFAFSIIHELFANIYLIETSLWSSNLRQRIIVIVAFISADYATIPGCLCNNSDMYIS